MPAGRADDGRRGQCFPPSVVQLALLHVRRRRSAANCALALDTCNDEGPAAIDRYMADDGANNAFVGHRRWLLYPGLTRTGLGIVPPEPRQAPGRERDVGARRGSGGPAGRASGRHVAAGRLRARAAGLQSLVVLVSQRRFLARGRARDKDGVPLLAALEPLGRQSRLDGSGVSVGNNTLAWTLPGNSVGRATDERYEVCVDNVVVAGISRQFNYPVTSIPVGAVEGRVVATVAVTTYGLAGTRRNR